MEDWKTPKSRLKGAIKSAVLKGLSVSGRFEALDAADKKTVPCEPVQFYGHRIGEAGGMGLHTETRIAFHQKRPDYEVVENLAYSETGMGWSGGRLVERFSVTPIRLADFRHRPQPNATTITSCAVVECDCLYTYGDWTHCCLGTILSADFPDVPVLLPRFLAQKCYVRRDLEKAGINWIATDGWTDIKRAYVLRKPNPLTYWSKREVIAYRKAFAVNPVAPLEGSVTYLGRFEVEGELRHRAYPSAEVAAYIASIGGKVVKQADLNTGTAPAYAAQADVVIGDHGSGMLNTLFWQPRTIIELVVDDWWVNNTVFAAHGMGVENFGVIRVDGLSSVAIGDLIAECLDSFR